MDCDSAVYDVFCFQSEFSKARHKLSQFLLHHQVATSRIAVIDNNHTMNHQIQGVKVTVYMKDFLGALIVFQNTEIHP